jgi:hypothetical protein
MANLLGEGSQADEVTRLKREIAGLEQELEDAKAEAKSAKQAAADSVQAIRALRKALDPFHTAIGMIYGEISRLDAGEVDIEVNGRDVRWEHIKQKFPGKPAEIIELLLIHKNLSTGQLAAMAKADPRTITRAIFVLNKAQLLDKNGGKFSLKSL